MKTAHHIAIALLLISSLGLFACNKPKQETLRSSDIVQSGYRYLVFGNQNTDGIELYDIKNGQFNPFLVGDKTKLVRYINPVIGKSGKGFCVRTEWMPGTTKAKVELVSIDITARTHANLPIATKDSFSNELALSSDEKLLAVILNKTPDAEPRLGIIDVTRHKMIATFVIDKRFAENRTKLMWKQDNKTIVLWDIDTGLAGVEINAITGTTNPLDIYPLDFKSNFLLAYETSKQEYLYLLDTVSGVKKSVGNEHRTAHSFSLSSDGKYLIYGWLRGFGGFENLVIRDLNSDKEMPVKMIPDHASTVIGLAIW